MNINGQSLYLAHIEIHSLEDGEKNVTRRYVNVWAKDEYEAKEKIANRYNVTWSSSDYRYADVLDITEAL